MSEVQGATLDRGMLLEAYALPDRSRPRVRMNFVSSLDGAVTVRGSSGGLGDANDRLAMQVLRTLADVVLVGAGTVRVEGYGGVRVGETDASPHTSTSATSSSAARRATGAAAWVTTMGRTTAAAKNG